MITPNTIRNIIVLLAGLTFTSCAPRVEDSSRIVIHVPKASSSSGKVGSLAIEDFSLSCISIHVSASDLPKRRLTSCAPEVSITSDWAAPGGTIVLEVPRGRGRRLEVFAYQKATATEACPSSRLGASGVPAARVVRVGEVAQFDTTEAEVTVAVNVAMPAAGTNLVGQYQLPVACLAENPGDGKGAARVVLGSAIQSGGALRVHASVSAQTNEITLTGGALKLQLSRKKQD